VLDNFGNPHISYQTDKGLKYAFVPEPGTILLLGIGGVIWLRRNRVR